MIGIAVVLAAGGLAAVASDAGAQPASALSQEGWKLWQSGQMAEAEKKFEAAVEQDPKDVSAWNGLGWARFNGGDSVGAVEAFDQCVELAPKHPAAQNGLGQVYLSWNEYEPAEKHLKKAAPNAPAAWFGLARLYMLTGEYDQAKRWIRKSLTQQPGDADLKRLLESAKKGELDEETRAKMVGPGRPSEAEQKLAADPDRLTVPQAWQLLNRGQPDKAADAFAKILEVDADNFGANNGMGFALLNAGEAGKAKAYFNKCLELEPKAAGPMNGLARCLYSEDKLDEAIALWEKMQKQNPGVNAATVGLASTYLEQGEHAKALPYYQQLLKAYPKNQQYRQAVEACEEAIAQGKDAESDKKKQS